MAAYVQHDDPFFSRRTLTFLLIVGLHGMMIYALATGLGHRVIAAIPAGLITDFIEPARHPLPPPPTREPTLVRPRVDDFKVPPMDFDPGVSTGGVAVISDPLPSQPPAAPVKVVNRMLGGPGKGFPNTESFYPPAEIRNNHTGAVTVRTCVDEKGRLTAAPTIAESSGFENLDAGALSLAKAGSGHYRPTTEDGVAVSSCYPVHIRFQLTSLGR